MFAVIQISGKQYKVQKGDTLEVAKIDGKEGDTITIDKVLLVSDDKNVQIGTPVVAGAAVKAKIVSQGQGKKLYVGRYKHKVRYRKTIGFRPQITNLEIVAIG
jgi:large subunit ribosomal protein L21